MTTCRDELDRGSCLIILGPVFLKSIELFGFKSFADRSKVEFTPGISALLGPNGCGKSNIVDAIKWVLGEQGTKSLRAEKMEDVIFNGTESRKALNVAEVTLVLENDGGILPIESAEIAVKRRLFRSGESEYYINNTPVKLRELKTLFYDTGIGKSAYSIMEQGKIDQVLSHRPEERRAIFEEAAAITKYRVKGQEAERKLEKTEENMRQVESIIGEVKRSHDSLQKQAEKTEAYRSLQDQIFEVELDLQLLRLKDAVDTRDKRQATLGKRQAGRDSVKQEIDGLNEHLEAELESMNSMESSLIDAQKRMYGLEVERSNREGTLTMLKGRVGEIEESVEHDKTRIKAADEKIAALTAEREERGREAEEARGRLTEVDANIAGFQEDLETTRRRIADNDAAVDAQEKRIVELEASEEEIRVRLAAITDNLVKELDETLASRGYTAGERRRLEGEIREAIDTIIIQAEGKADMAGDALSVGKAADIRRRLEASQDSWTKILDAARSARSLVAEYGERFAGVLDELVAPEGVITQKRQVDAEAEDVRTRINKSRQDIANRRAENKELSEKAGEYRKTLEELRVNRASMKSRLEAVEEQLARSGSEIEDQSLRKQEIVKSVERSQERLRVTHEDITRVNGEIAGLDEEHKKLLAEVRKLEEGIAGRHREVGDKERLVKEKVAQLAREQEQVETLRAGLAEVGAEIRNIYSNFEERHSRNLADYESRRFDIKASGKEIRDRLAGLKEKRRGLGHVNLMAPEEFAEIKERYDFLTSQLDDLKRARTDLARVTEEIRTESRELFLETYERVKKNFHAMFRRLFGGGRGELRLLDNENVLESGIEIYAQPPGKKLENIALLSGGERSLTAVALLFATYMVRPSPFCLLDEIDAALDENNVGRFVNLLVEFAQNSQFIVITHNKRTVAGAGSLLGVTMEESGVSRIISIRLDRSDNPEPVHA